jgi:hypothetical protein
MCGIRDTCLQANPVCQHKGYKSGLLAALPKLTNLDGERNPKESSCTSAQERCVSLVNNCTALRPDFDFTTPAPWFTTEQLKVADVPRQMVGIVLLQRLAQVHAKLDVLRQDCQALADVWAS